MSEAILSCRCGACQIAVAGPPIMAVECCCASCRQAAERMEALPGAVRERTAHDAVPFVMHRKDRVRMVKGGEHLADFTLSSGATTRRAMTTCCNSPFWTDFTKGHWLSFHAARWPAETRPSGTCRTMVVDRPVGAEPLPEDMPNLRHHNFGFMWRLLASWAMMGFKVPKITYAEREFRDA